MTQTSPIQTTGNRLVFEDSIQVQAPIGEVYRRWTDFQRFPDFMSNVEEVRPLGGDRYHWVARIFGVKQEWDAEVIDQQPNSRVSWRSISGPYNQGTVSFSQLGTGNTEVRLRLEYAPPLGKAGQALDQITQTTKRETMEDLNNFRKLLTGQRDEYMFQEGEKVISGPAGLLTRVMVPAAVGIAGGLIGYNLEKRARESNPLLGTTSPVETPAATAGWIFTAASAASVATSAALRMRGDRKNSLFVGQWAPTLLTAGILSRTVGHRGIRTPLNTAGTSWGFAAATLGSIATSALLHARGRRNDGLFVGQWAPTFLSAALLARLFDR
ncbi:MAG TPA: SRPBCC family protein [Ktedonobacterales bacterium]